MDPCKSDACVETSVAETGEISPKNGPAKHDGAQVVDNVAEIAFIKRMKSIICPFNERYNVDSSTWIPMPLPLPNGNILEDRLFTCRAPQELTSVHNRTRFQTLCEEKKVTTVINLMEDHEDTTHAHICLDSYYEHIKLDVTRFAMDKQKIPEPKSVLKLVKKILGILAKKQRILIHCDDGSDRTGMIVMIILRALGVHGNPLPFMRKLNSEFVMTRKFEKFAMNVDSMCRKQKREGESA